MLYLLLTRIRGIPWQSISVIIKYFVYFKSRTLDLYRLDGAIFLSFSKWFGAVDMGLIWSHLFLPEFFRLFVCRSHLSRFVNMNNDNSKWKKNICLQFIKIQIVFCVFISNNFIIYTVNTFHNIRYNSNLIIL